MGEELSTNNLPSAVSTSPLISLTSLQESQHFRNTEYGKDPSAFPVSDRQPWHIERMKQRNNHRRTVKCGEEDNSGNFMMVWNRSIPFTTTAGSTSNITAFNTNCNNTNWNFIPTTESSQHLTNSNTNSQIDNVDKLVATSSICMPSLTDRSVKTSQGLQSSVAMTTAFQKVPSLCSKSYTAGHSSWPGSRIASKEVAELLYQDPVSGAPTSFLQRLNEIAALEAETVRQERARKLKKKNKHDKESYSY